MNPIISIKERVMFTPAGHTNNIKRQAHFTALPSIHFGNAIHIKLMKLVDVSLIVFSDTIRRELK